MLLFMLNWRAPIRGPCVHLSCDLALTVPSVIASSRYELLHVLNFDPVRRRMSVIVRSSSGERQMTVGFSAAPRNFMVDLWHSLAVRVFVVPPQATRCSSARVPTLPFFPASSRRRWRGYARTWSAMQQWVACLQIASAPPLFLCHRHCCTTPGARMYFSF